MRLALDEFEVEGIGHNLPCLSAVARRSHHVVPLVPHADDPRA
jgi:hypothetical protein